MAIQGRLDAYFRRSNAKKSQKIGIVDRKSGNTWYNGFLRGKSKTKWSDWGIMEDRRKIEGIEGALRKVLKRTKTTPTKLANKHGIDRKYIFSAYRSALISGKALDVLDMCGYRLAFVPKGAKMPEGTVLLPDREPIVAEKMPKKPKIEHIAETDHDGDTENTPVSDSQAISDGVSTGYVSYIVHN